MLSAPTYRNRVADHILGERLYYDSAGHLYRAASWLDHCERAPRFTTLCYACIEARLGIEYLLFEELIISTGASLSRDDYERCLKSRVGFAKIIAQLSPHHEKAQQFTRIVAEIEGASQVSVFWSPTELMKSWGKLSRYLHWSGSRLESTEDPEWLLSSFKEVKAIIVPIWTKMASGYGGLLHPSKMAPRVTSIWADFRDGKINEESAKIRLKIARP